MNYDIHIHIPTQIENMLQAETLFRSNPGTQVNPLELFMNSVENLKEFFAENGFIQDIADYEKERDQGINDAKKLFIDEWKQAFEEKTVDDQLKMLVNAETNLEMKITGIHAEYMNTVKTYILSYIRHSHAT